MDARCQKARIIVASGRITWAGGVYHVPRQGGSITEPPPKGGAKGGRPAVPLSDAAFASVFRVYVGFSVRRLTCDLQDAADRGYLLRPIGPTSVIKAMESDALTPVLHDLIRR